MVLADCLDCMMQQMPARRPSPQLMVRPVTASMTALSKLGRVRRSVFDESPAKRAESAPKLDTVERKLSQSMSWQRVGLDRPKVSGSQMKLGHKAREY